MLYIEDKVDVETHPILERKTVITLGNFDGIHLGHRQLLDQAIQIAKDRESRDAFLYIFAALQQPDPIETEA